MTALVWQIFTGILGAAFLLCLYLAIILRKALNNSLNREERAYQELLDYPGANPNPVMRTNKQGVLLYANPACAPIMTNWQVGMNDKIPPQWRELVREVLISDKMQVVDLPCEDQFYTLSIVPMGGGYASLFGMDITARVKIEKELERRSTIDELTSLPNRVIFKQNLAIEINHAISEKTKFGVSILRIDDYYDIINTFDQEVANLLIQAFCKRLNELATQRSTFARINENEFGLIEPKLKEPASLVSFVQSVIEKCTLPYRINNNDIFITVSIGIAFYPSDGETSDVLARNAHIALNRTSSSRNQYEFFQRGMVEQLQIKRNIITDLHKALENNQFVLYYQPQINLKLRQMIGCEALIRWNHPQKGFVSPFFFMTAAEETQLIMPIGEWVLKEACQQILYWQQQGLAPIKVAVNVSARQFFEGNLIELVSKTLHDTQISPEWLELELTESALMQDMGRAVEIMKGLRKLGVELALDDFGTGYSSLSYLMQFPVNKIKIDRSFVKVIEEDKEGNYAVTKGIIDLGHSLNLKVVAEGVETKAQLRYLKQHKCDLVQGYYFAQPLPPEKFEALFSSDWNV